MDHATLIAALKTYDGALRENGATRVYIFGSRARGDHRPDSDLDLFIDYDPANKVPDIFRLMELEEKLGNVLGVSVTITTRNALHPLMREQIERDAVRVLPAAAPHPDPLPVREDERGEGAPGTWP
jgi:predicted nucleotidyltransferase